VEHEYTGGANDRTEKSPGPNNWARYGNPVAVNHFPVRYSGRTQNNG